MRIPPFIFINFSVYNGVFDCVNKHELNKNKQSLSTSFKRFLNIVKALI